MSTFHIHRPHAQSRNISSFLWDHLSHASPIGEGVTHHRSCLNEIQDVRCCVTLTHFMDQKIGKPMSTLIQQNWSFPLICLPLIMTLGTCSRFSVNLQKCRGSFGRACGSHETHFVCWSESLLDPHHINSLPFNLILQPPWDWKFMRVLSPFDLFA